MSFKASDLEKKVEEQTIRYRRMIDNLPDVPFPAGIGFFQKEIRSHADAEHFATSDFILTAVVF